MARLIGGGFVGVSSQVGPRIPTLRYGARDANRLAALFGDAAEQAGSDPTLVKVLTDEQATAAGVVASLQQSAASSQNQRFDLFLVHFSCHGLPGGQIMLHDSIFDEAGHEGLSLAVINDV